MDLRIIAPKAIVIHHSATADGDSLSWGILRRNAIELFGQDDISYHAGCELVRGQFECLYGRPEQYVGAHEPKVNRTSLGFCFVGNYDVVEPPIEMLEVAAFRVLVPWIRAFRLQVDDIHPHREYTEKTCPGRMFSMDLLRGICDDILGGRRNA